MRSLNDVALLTGMRNLFVHKNINATVTNVYNYLSELECDAVLYSYNNTIEVFDDYGLSYLIVFKDAKNKNEENKIEMIADEVGNPIVSCII